MFRAVSFLLLLLIGAVANSCQYPVGSTDLPDPQQFIVIDAELTEAYGRVRVAYTLTDVTSQGAYLFPTPPNATAYVVDSKGNQTYFNTDGSKDTAFKGVPGETYRLYVTADGQSYESSAETMRSCPELDTLIPLYTRESNRDSRDILYDGFDVYVELQDTPGQQDYYQWDWIHYKRSISCDKIEEAGMTVQVPCKPYDCWNIKYNTRVIVQSDKLRDGTRLAHRIVRVPYATPPLTYYLRVEQRAITPTVFDYMKSLEIQTQNTGSIFDIPAQTRFSPNIRNVNNPKEQILGVFNVFSFRQKILHINMRQQIPGASAKYVGDPTPFTENDLLTAPCVEGLYRTQIRPEGWID